MSAKEKNFIVVNLGDKDSYGFDELSLPKLLTVVDSTKPDARFFFHSGVIAYYCTSRRSLKAVEQVVSDAERLKSSDPKLSSLGVGVSEGLLIADFDWLGRVKSMPMGDAANEAARGVRVAGQSSTMLRELRERIS